MAGKDLFVERHGDGGVQALLQYRVPNTHHVEVDETEDHIHVKIVAGEAVVAKPKRVRKSAAKKSVMKSVAKKSVAKKSVAKKK